jgi:hypothetical protein
MIEVRAMEVSLKMQITLQKNNNLVKFFQYFYLMDKSNSGITTAANFEKSLKNVG